MHLKQSPPSNFISNSDRTLLKFTVTSQIAIFLRMKTAIPPPLIKIPQATNSPLERTYSKNLFYEELKAVLVCVKYQFPSFLFPPVCKSVNNTFFRSKTFCFFPFKEKSLADQYFNLPHKIVITWRRNKWTSEEKSKLSLVSKKLTTCTKHGKNIMKELEPWLAKGF